MLEALRQNPDLLVKDLPDATAWLSRLLRTPVELNPDEPFLDQAVTLANQADYVADVSTWDPYDEGYDDGPGNLDDSWHTNDRSSTGQFCGMVVECPNVFDVLGAIVIALAENCQDPDEFEGLAAKDWSPPLGQEKRDKKTTKSILHDWSRLSPTARRALLVKLTQEIP